MVLTRNQDPPEVRTAWRRQQKIAISKGVRDSGLFELNFHDDRYLPFEGTGAVSRWKLDMPKKKDSIDHASISDVIIHLALYGGGWRVRAGLWLLRLPGPSWIVQ